MINGQVIFIFKKKEKKKKKTNKQTNKKKKRKRKKQTKTKTHKCISSPHVIPTNLYARFRNNDRRLELVAIGNLLVRVVNYIQSNTWSENVYHLSHYSPHT